MAWHDIAIHLLHADSSKKRQKKDRFRADCPIILLDSKYSNTNWVSRYFQIRLIQKRKRNNAICQWFLFEKLECYALCVSAFDCVGEMDQQVRCNEIELHKIFIPHKNSPNNKTKSLFIFRTFFHMISAHRIQTEANVVLYELENTAVYCRHCIVNAAHADIACFHYSTIEQIACVYVLCSAFVHCTHQ